MKSPVLKKFRRGGGGVGWRFVVAAEREREKGRNQENKGKKEDSQE